MHTQQQTATVKPRKIVPPKIVCSICGRAPFNEDVSLFAAAPKPDEPRRLYCAECLPLAAARRRLERSDLRDPDAIAIFTRRVESRQ